MTDPLRDRVTQLLVRLFDQHSIVVWQDPSSRIGALLRECLPDHVGMPEFAGNPLSIRQVVDLEDPWLERRWLLYVPELPAGTNCTWLGDFEQEFHSVPEGDLAWLLRELFNLADSSDVAPLLRGPAGGELLKHFGELFPTGVSTLSPDDVLLALLRSAVGEPAATEVDLVLVYLASDADERRLRELDLLPSLTTIVNRRLGLTRRMAAAQAPDQDELCRCMVACALVEADAADAKALSNHLPQEEFRARWAKALADGLSRAEQGTALRQAIHTALRGSKLTLALTDPFRLASGPSLPFVDERLSELLRERRPVSADELALASWWQEIEATAAQRVVQPGLLDNMAKLWRAVHAAAKLLAETQRRTREIARYPEECFEQLALDYTRRESGDHEIDRLLTELPAPAEKLPGAWHDALLEPARVAYSQWVRRLTERFVAALHTRQKYSARGFLRQTSFWTELVEPGRGAVAVLLVDALRADLAYRVAALLERGGRVVTVRNVLAELPSRTEVGMAALLPQAESGFEVRVDGGRLVSTIGGVPVRDVVERERYLAKWLEARGRRLCRAHVTELLARDALVLREAFDRGDSVVAHTTDIDEGGPIGTSVTFSAILTVVEQCAALVERALSLGYERVVIASDHGFLTREDSALAGDAGPTDAAGGPFARGLRYAAGSGETRGLVRVPAEALARVGADVYVPRDSGCIAIQGGAGSFVHGGVSPQECALAFLVVTPGSGKAPDRVVRARLEVPERVTSLTFKVSVVVEASAAPAITPSRRLRVRLDDARRAPTWSGEIMTVEASGATIEIPVVVLVGGAGYHSVVLEDVDQATVIETRQVRVEVLGDDFGF